MIMSDIELVIKIPEGLKNDFESEQWTALSCMEMKDALEKATPLPKGHGKLIDADELKKEYPHDTDWEYPVNTNSYVVESIDNMTTIIEADKEVAE